MEAVIYIADKDQTYRSNPDCQELPIELLRETTIRGEVVIDWQQRRCIVPLRIGVRPVGALGVSGESLSRETLEAMSGLAAIAIERAGAVESLGRMEAAREGERLRSALLDSVTHEFRTPLTSIKASLETLLHQAQLNQEQRDEMLAVMKEEVDRINRLVGEAVEMSQLDTGEVELDLQPRPIPRGHRRITERCKACARGTPCRSSATGSSTERGDGH